jgi:hypothetical protein
MAVNISRLTPKGNWLHSPTIRGIKTAKPHQSPTGGVFALYIGIFSPQLDNPKNLTYTDPPTECWKNNQPKRKVMQMRLRERYGMHGAMSIVSAIAVTGLLVALNLTAVILAVIANH